MNFLTIATFRALRRRIEKIINYVFESLTPSPCGHSPYLIYDEQRESVDTLMRFLCCGYLEAVLNLFRGRLRPMLQHLGVRDARQGLNMAGKHTCLQ